MQLHFNIALDFYRQQIRSKNMNQGNTFNGLNEQVIRLVFWSAIIVILTLLASFFIPFDLPTGCTT
jgi:hypothetical protein